MAVSNALTVVEKCCACSGSQWRHAFGSRQAAKETAYAGWPSHEFSTRVGETGGYNIRIAGSELTLNRQTQFTKFCLLALHTQPQFTPHCCRPFASTCYSSRRRRSRQNFQLPIRWRVWSGWSSHADTNDSHMCSLHVWLVGRAAGHAAGHWLVK